MANHVPIFRRRRSGATDYKARRKAITAGNVLLAVRISGKNVSAQFIQPAENGDKIVSATHSRALKKIGWNGSLKSVPACYLLGLLAGKKAKSMGLKQAFLYNGPSPFIRGSRSSAVVKGVKDAGLDVPMAKEALPSEEKLTGKTTAAYATSLMNENKEVYAARFSGLLKQGFKPEEYEQKTAAMKQTILGTK